MRQVIAGAKVTSGVLVALLAGTAIAHAQADDAAMAALMDTGEAVFNQRCNVCHGADGGGGEGPAFIGNARLESISTIMDQVIRGGAYMPPFGGILNDEQVAGVATYIRNSFTNSFGIVTAAQVATYR